MRYSEMWHMRMQRVTRQRERERDREKWSRISNEDTYFADQDALTIIIGSTQNRKDAQR